MKTSFLACLTVIGLAGSGLCPINANAQSGFPDRRFGAGAILGEPTGASLKYWIADRSAVDGVVGWSFDGRDNLYLHSNYLHHWFDLIDVGRDQFAVYGGGGVRYQLINQRSDRFGLRAVGGVAYLFNNIPIDVFLELGPILDLTPRRQVRFGGGVGARYWF